MKEIKKSVDVYNINKIKRRKTREINVDNIKIGGNNPIVVQEMVIADPKNIDITVSEIKSLEDAGCKLVRVSVPDEDSARAIKYIKEQIEIPLIADIHFNYKLALMAIENGIDKLRINPGNIGSLKGVSMLVSAAKERAIPIRVGVNSGSLDKDIVKKYGGITKGGMVESALKEVSILEQYGFYNTIISLKSSDVGLTIEANKMISSKVDYPLHIGITESGYGEKGIIRSIVGLGALLLSGIGDTLRISLTNMDRVENLKICFSMLDELRVSYI